jgi:hypothetical protein
MGSVLNYFKALLSNLAEETIQTGQNLIQNGNSAKWFSKPCSSEHEAGVLTIQQGHS